MKSNRQGLEPYINLYTTVGRVHWSCGDGATHRNNNHRCLRGVAACLLWRRLSTPSPLMYSWYPLALPLSHDFLYDSGTSVFDYVCDLGGNPARFTRTPRLALRHIMFRCSSYSKWQFLQQNLRLCQSTAAFSVDGKRNRNKN